MTGVITLTGENFDTLGVENGTDVKSQLNFAGDVLHGTSRR